MILRNIDGSADVTSAGWSLQIDTCSRFFSTKIVAVEVVATRSMIMVLSS